MSTPDTKLTIELATLLKGLQPTLKGLDKVEKKLRTVANVKANTTATVQSLNKAALASQRLLQQQQRLSVQSQELSNRQERARQATERLALSQKKAADAAQKFTQRVGQQANAHVKDFRAAEKAAEKLRLSQERLAKQSAASLQRQRSSSLTSQQRGQEQAAISLQRQRSAALIKNFKDQEKAAKDAAKKREQEAKKAADAEIREAKRAAKQITENQRRLISGLQSFGQGLKSLGQSLTVGLTVPLTALGVLATRNAVSLDSLKRGLTAITGSAADAAVQLDRLREIAKAPGIGFQEAIQGSIRLQAVGFSALEAERALKQFANAVALTGGGRDELERVTVQLGQLAAKGKVVAQDLKPIIEAAPAVGQALLQAFGTVNSEDIQKLGLSTDEFLDKLLDALNDLPKAAAGAKNAFENFSDSVFVATSAIGEAILPPLTRIINTLEPIILDLAEKFRALSPGIQTAIVAVAALAAAAGPVLFILGGIVTGIGSLITGLVAVAGVLGTIGFPGILAALAGVVALLTEWATIAFVVFRAWQTNFLGIRGLVSNAATAVLKAFRDIKAVIDEATQRILPTLESITNKVVGAITKLWELYGKQIVEIVGESFAFIVDVTTTFLRVFGDFVDLVAKLIDSDWQGAWRAFSRIVITALGGIAGALFRLNSIVNRAFRALLAFILAQAVRFIDAAEQLAKDFIVALAREIILGAPKVRDALTTMLFTAAAGVNPTGIAALLIRRLFEAMRKEAARDSETSTGPNVGVDVGTAPSFGRKRKRTTPPAPDGDKRARDLLEKLRQAQDELLTIQAEGQLENVRAGIEQQFQLTKDGLDRELELVKANFDDRLVVVKGYFEQRRKLEESAIDAELAREKGLSNALFQEFANRRAEVDREFQATKEDIERDPKLKGRQRILALQTAEQKKQNAHAKALNDFESQNADVSTRILLLQRQRKRLAGDLTRAEKNLTEELTRQRDSLGFDLLEEQGALSDAAAGRLTAQFKDTLKDLRVDLTSLSPELQKAINNVDLSLLKTRLEELPEPVRVLIQLLDIGIQRARIAERVVDVDRTLAELRIQEGKTQDKVVDGVLTERQARERILTLQQITRGRLLDILAAQLEIAKATQGQEDEVLRIEGQIQEIERLGKVADSVGQEINRALFDDIGSGLTDLLNSARQGFDGLKEAALGFLNNILNTLNRFAAEGILQKLEGVFKPDAGDTKGTPGGFLSKIFGLSPKTADTAALTTAATTAGTALTTGATAASAALTTGGATAGTTLVASMTAAASAFSAAVIAAGAAFAAAVGASSAANAVGGLGAAFGAATGIFPAVPGGMVRIVEGGYPEAVLTTDPKHAAQQVQILKAYLKKTKGLFGRIKLPELAEGGFISARDAEMNLLSSIQRSPSLVSSVPEAALASGPSGGPMSVRVINQLTSRTAARPYITSEEGVRDILNIISSNAPEVARRIGVRR